MRNHGRDPCGVRTQDPEVARQIPYPLGHRSPYIDVTTHIFPVFLSFFLSFFLHVVHFFLFFLSSFFLGRVSTGRFAWNKKWLRFILYQSFGGHRDIFCSDIWVKDSRSSLRFFNYTVRYIKTLVSYANNLIFAWIFCTILEKNAYLITKAVTTSNSQLRFTLAVYQYITKYSLSTSKKMQLSVFELIYKRFFYLFSKKGNVVYIQKNIEYNKV